MTPANLLAEWSRLLVASLVRAGITDAVLSPGSRSTPLVCALGAEHALRVHTLIDERSAGFFALGQARATGKPSLCVCTSGSAVANYYPAVIEAAHSRVPLVILSADRPFELLEARAPQTIDQTKIFGGYARAFVELGMPDPHPDALAALARRAAQAVVRSRWPEPGAVHLNFRARKPLEPEPATTDEAQALARRVDDLLSRPSTRIAPPAPAFAADAVARLTERLSASRRTLIACGPMPMTELQLGAAVVDLAARAGALLVAESASQVRHGVPADLAREHACDAFDALLDSEAGRRALEPELIVQFGRPLVSGAWERFVHARRDLERWLVTDAPDADPAASAREIVVGDATGIAGALAAALESRAISDALRTERAAWRRRATELNRRAWEAVAQASDGGAELTEARAAQIALASVRADEILALGNSLPIRDADWFCRGATARFSVWAQRGTNGIDGVLSGAAGAAAGAGRPTTLIIGDIGFLHDIGGLWAAREASSPLVIVVLDNGGGRIFEQLPLADRTDLPSEWLERWTTPHALELEHAARLYGIEVSVADTGAALEAAIARARARTGPTLVIAKVEPSSARRQRRRIAALVGEKLAEP